jgi:hypothetical protein
LERLITHYLQGRNLIHVEHGLWNLLRFDSIEQHMSPIGALG